MRHYVLNKFSTMDDDNDEWLGGSCAEQFRAGWWFDNFCTAPGTHKNNRRKHAKSVNIVMKLKPYY